MPGDLARNPSSRVLKSLFTVSDQGPTLTTCLRGFLLANVYYSCGVGGGLLCGVGVLDAGAAARAAGA